MTITNQPSAASPQGPRRQSTSTRLPSARERRPALAALAVLLIAGGAVLAGWLALRQSQNSEYIKVNTSVAKDSQIQREDLDTIELPSDSENFIPKANADQVIGKYAAVDMVKDQVLLPDMIGEEPEFGDDGKVGLQLSPDQYPRGLTVGSTVWVNLLASTGDGGEPIMTTLGTVREFDESESGGGADVTVAISMDCANLYSAADGDVSLVEIGPEIADDDNQDCVAGKVR